MVRRLHCPTPGGHGACCCTPEQLGSIPARLCGSVSIIAVLQAPPLPPPPHPQTWEQSLAAWSVVWVSIACCRVLTAACVGFAPPAPATSTAAPCTHARPCFPADPLQSC